MSNQELEEYVASKELPESGPTNPNGLRSILGASDCPKAAMKENVKITSSKYLFIEV